MSNVKTNAMRILDSNNINYNTHKYDVKKEDVDGVYVAKLINKNPDEVYKTLVTKGSDNNIYVFVTPVDKNLDLKKSANACKEKNISMIEVNNMQKITGYIRGGCSPIGMKKNYKTFISDLAIDKETIIISAGKKGHQIEITPTDLIKVTDAKFSDITK